MAEIIANNPFRILGVAANASPRDILSNENRMKAFLKVKKPVSFPLDLSEILGAPERNQESITAADTSLTIKADRLRAALFWWINGATPFDQTAFRHVEAGDLDAALSVWEKQENMSSLANASLIHLIKGNHRPAAVAASKLFDKYAAELAQAVDVQGASATEMVVTYVNTVIAQWPGVDVQLIIGEGFPNSWNSAARSAIVMPIISHLTEALQRCRLSKGKDPKTRYLAGITLDRDTKDIFGQLRKVVKINDIELVNISDKIANEILQCSIDAYNDVDDPDYAEEAIKLLIRAKRIALGTVTKERIKENEAILRNIIASIPPKAARQENEKLDEILKDVEGYAKTPGTARMLLDRARPVLNQISQALPPEQKEFAINRNSTVANEALNILIDYVNTVQRSLSGISDVDIFKSIRSSVHDARDITQSLTSMQLDAATAARVRQNLSTINDICSQLDAVKTEKSFTEQLSGCWIYIIIMILVGLMQTC